MKEKIAPYQIAAALLILAPFALADWCNKRKYALVTTFAVTITFIIICIIATAWTPSNPEAVETIAMTDVSAQFATGNMRSSTEWIVIHHTAGGKDCTVDDIAKIHLIKNGWSTIGYHYFINHSGEIYKLHRDGEVAPSTFSYNNNTVAICLSGNFDNYEPSAAQWKSLVKLTKMLMRRYKLSASHICGHRHLNVTDCPGSLLDIEKLKKEVQL